MNLFTVNSVISWYDKAGIPKFIHIGFDHMKVPLPFDDVVSVAFQTGGATCMSKCKIKTITRYVAICINRIHDHPYRDTLSYH